VNSIVDQDPPVGPAAWPRRHRRAPSPPRKGVR
jgi:hypothetical protein